MKRENGIYLLAFIAGVVIVNLLGNETWGSNSILNRYQLISLSFHGMDYEEYLVHVLLLRLKTVAGLWIASKLIPEKIVMFSFAFGNCVLLGGIVAIAILSNGIWGVWLIICALFPHAICYGLAYSLWNYRREVHIGEKKSMTQYLSVVLIVVLVVVGCILETYISPILIENIIKY